MKLCPWQDEVPPPSGPPSSWCPLDELYMPQLWHCLRTEYLPGSDQCRRTNWTTRSFKTLIGRDLSCRDQVPCTKSDPELPTLHLSSWCPLSTPFKKRGEKTSLPPTYGEPPTSPRTKKCGDTSTMESPTTVPPCAMPSENSAAEVFNITEQRKKEKAITLNKATIFPKTLRQRQIKR